VNPFLAAVNQKRLFAALLLGEAAGAADSHLREALVQGALSHLGTALQLYFAEVAASYQCRDALQATSPGALERQLSAMGKTAAEVSEILALAEDDSSWLSRVVACQRALSAPPGTVSRRGREDIIDTLSIAPDQDTQFNLADVERWLAAFTSMVERQRESMVEC